MDLTRDDGPRWRLSGDLHNARVAAELAEPGRARGLWFGARYCWFWNDLHPEGLDQFFRASITPRYEMRQGKDTDRGVHVLHAAAPAEYSEELLIPHWSGENDPDREELRQIFIEGFLERAAVRLFS